MRSMLPLTIFRAMSAWLGPLLSCGATGAFQGRGVVGGCRTDERPRRLSSTRDRVGRGAGGRLLCTESGQMKPRPDGASCAALRCAERLAAERGGGNG